jgi:4'-phosphopantetheinyl transferase
MRTTDAPGWLSQRQADVPPGDEWLGPAEREVLAGLRVAPRRASWRLGRWTAKAALGCWLEVEPAAVEVLAAPDGAPEAWLHGARAPVSVSLSHRGDRALAVVAHAPTVVGCDLELIEPRSGAFIREWLTAAEQELVFGCDEARQALLANLIWTAKEAAAKVRREGLRLDVRHARVTLIDGGATAGDWCPVQVDWGDGAAPTLGWWRAAAASVMTIAAAPACRAPGAGLTPPAATPAASAAGPAPGHRAA